MVELALRSTGVWFSHAAFWDVLQGERRLRLLLCRFALLSERAGRRGGLPALFNIRTASREFVMLFWFA